MDGHHGLAMEVHGLFSGVQQQMLSCISMKGSGTKCFLELDVVSMELDPGQVTTFGATSGNA